MFKLATLAVLALLLPACASRLDVVVENQSEQPLDLVISTPRPKGGGTTGYPPPGDLFHIELAPGDHWRSSAAMDRERVDRSIHPERVVVIERESHLRSTPSPTAAGIQVTQFRASPENGRVTLVFGPGGWGYSATFRDGTSADVTPLDYADAARSSDAREALKRWAAWQPDAPVR